MTAPKGSSSVQSSTGAGPSLPDALVRAAAAIDPAMRVAVGRVDPELRRIAEYHLGWSDPEGRVTHGHGGKAVRPAIALLASEACGAPPEAALPGAVAIELVHNFSLIHDDVMDGDRERRHRPTVWALFGVGQAILVGDALTALAQQVLLEDPRPQARRAARDLADATAEMIRGQAEDLSFESRMDVTVEQCLRMCEHKTGALLACAGALGAVLAGAADGPVEALRTFGRHVGVAFQAVDDVLGVWGDPAVTGKPAASDLRQRKKTLPVVHALQAGGPRTEDLFRLLTRGNQETTDQDVDGAVAALDAARSREWALELADRHLAEAMAALVGAGLRGDAVEELREVGRFIVGRDR